MACRLFLYCLPLAIRSCALPSDKHLTDARAHLLFTNSLIVRLSPGSWLPNWLHGQASTYTAAEITVQLTTDALPADCLTQQRF